MIIFFLRSKILLFSSNIFIFVFLPLVIFIYYTVLKNKRTMQNVFLCIASLFFYAWGEPKFILVMMGSIVFNYFMGLLVSKEAYRSTKAKLIIVLDIIFNLIIIFIFKYLMFVLNNVNNIFNSNIKVPEIALPIGISFFTFQAISYVIDVYRGKGKAQKNIINVGLYISFFPQLIAGPIVRYETVAEQIYHRKESWEKFSYGVKRFIIGLGKKVLLSNQMAVIADYAFNLSGNSLSVSMAWLGAVAYTLQIFFDFSGYSDMAIGLGKMFGFEFLENFNYPYISKSATEFWRRWHISLGSWFRDYLYIPLGGSRVDSKYRHIFNLFVVWLCTGIWHGANWTFICWGLLYFILLVIEKYSKFEIDGDKKSTNWIKHIYALFFIVMGWVLFRADNINMALDYYHAMFNFNGMIFSNDFVIYLRQYIVYIVAGIVFSMPVSKYIKGKIRENIITDILYVVGMLSIFIISVSFIVKGSYSPFIYFNF